MAVSRIVAIFTLNVSWDEFALLQRAATTARTGDVVGGGRPGLATLVLVPFAAECRNAVDAIVRARVLWTGLVVASAVALWVLLRSVLPPTPYRSSALATGVGLWVLAPPFLHASTQVRTDQPAILFGLLGGIALVASRRRVGWAPVAGILFGVGFLFSQKLLYVGGLVAALAVGHLVLRGEWRPRREVVRTALTGAAFVVLILMYREVIGQLSTPPTLLPISGELSTFEHYRAAVGWRAYRRLLPLILAQVFVVLCLVPLTLAWVRDRERHGRDLVLAWGVAFVGLAVLFFHAGRFFYFYLVLGLFPAVVGAVIVGPVLDRLEPFRQRRVFLALVWLPLAGLSLFQAGALTMQTQRHQEASLNWVERTFPPTAHGYNDWGAFACRPDPFPVRFFQNLRIEFGVENRAASIAALIAEFRNRPVMFMIPPVDPRYPEELRDFWSTRYVHYYGAIHVPGREMAGEPGWSATFEVIIPGEYVWRAAALRAAPLQVGEQTLNPGNTVVLDEPGLYPVRLPLGGEGIFAIMLPDPPAPGTKSFWH